MKKYLPNQVEAKWAIKWKDEGLFSPNLDKAEKPFYSLMMFPYPSAEGMHVGNMYAFTGSDVYSRFKRLQGYDVFEPIGLDGFGIHGENFAMKINEHPMEVSKRTEKHFYEQFLMVGNAFDWKRTVDTYKSNYYKWTQWAFLQLYKKGLAYRKKAEVNWCPSCLTVLADEQVISGECERCASIVGKKELEQWFFKITDYAEKLLQNIDSLDWSEIVKTAQRNWIGKSEGALIKFPFVIARNEVTRQSSQEEIASPTARKDNDCLEVFTTRPDTIFGATFIVISPEHPFVASLLKLKNKQSLRSGDLQNSKIKSDLEKYVEKSKQKSDIERQGDKEKTGIFTGSFVKNPLTGKDIPIWVADYVLLGYGTGAIMAVPAHDERDFEFAQKYNLPIKEVIEPLFIQNSEPGAFKPTEPIIERDSIMAVVKHWSENKYIGFKWKKVDWQTLITGSVEEDQTPEEALMAEIRQETGYKNAVLIKKLGIIHSKFFHIPKKENKFIHLHTFYLELKNGEQEAVSENENVIHELHWLSKEEMKQFLSPPAHQQAFSLAMEEGAYTGEGIMVNSGDFDGLTNNNAKQKITNYLAGHHLGSAKIQYHLRDWLISRQRYWGPPIPIIYCDKCGAQPVPEKDLPVELPYIKDFKPTGTGLGPLASDPDFVNTKCPNCGEKARRETDVSDNFFDSSLYFFRYLTTDLDDKFFDDTRTKKWLPVDMYIGGAEHSVLHLLYSRFITMAFKDLGFIDFEEPFTKFRAHGLIIKDGAKMSKSKGNVVVPDKYIKDWGADVFRAYLMFMGPFSGGGDFQDDGLNGVYRFLNRIWSLAQNFEEAEATEEEKRILNKTIQKAGQDFENLRYNTVVSGLMELLNFLSKQKTASKNTIKNLLIILSPLAPFITEELWEMMKSKTTDYHLPTTAEDGSQKTEDNNWSIHNQPWPKIDEKYLEDEQVILVVQVNGKVRERIMIQSDIVNHKEEVEKMVLKLPKISKYLKENSIKKIIYVPGKIINIVI